MDATEYLFVYGTLMRASGHPMHRLLHRHTRYLEKGTIGGRLYKIDGYPGMVDGEGRVYGEIYRILQIQPLFAILDEYEECAPSYPEPHEYRRVRRQITGMSGRHYHAWVYLYARPIDGRALIVSGDYLHP